MVSTHVEQHQALLHFRTPPIVIDDSSWKNAAESFAVALTLTLGGYESAIAPKKFLWNFKKKSNMKVFWSEYFGLLGVKSVHGWPDSPSWYNDSWPYI